MCDVLLQVEQVMGHELQAVHAAQARDEDDPAPLLAGSGSSRLFTERALGHAGIADG